MTSIDVRRAVHGDLPRIVELLDQLDRLHRDALPSLFRELDEPRSAERLEAFVISPTQAAFVAVRLHAGKLPVGVVTVELREASRAPVLRPARVAVVENLVVDPPSRRQGIGRRLVHQALQWARAAGAERTELGVYEFNDTARRFWESMGFTTMFRRMYRGLDGLS